MAARLCHYPSRGLDAASRRCSPQMDESTTRGQGKNLTLDKTGRNYYIIIGAPTASYWVTCGGLGMAQYPMSCTLRARFPEAGKASQHPMNGPTTPLRADSQLNAFSLSWAKESYTQPSPQIGACSASPFMESGMGGQTNPTSGNGTRDARVESVSSLGEVHLGVLSQQVGCIC